MKQREKDAQKLWAHYLLDKTNEDTFWQKYEALLEQEPEKGITDKVVEIISEKEKIYYSGTVPSFFLLVVITAGLLYGLIVFSQSKFGGWTLLGVSLLVFFILSAFSMFYQMFAYIKIAESGMYLKKGLWCKVHHFPWQYIKNVKLKESYASFGESENFYRKLYIESLEGNKPTKLDYPLSIVNHYSLVQAIEEKGIFYIYKGDKASKYSPQSMRKYLSAKRNKTL